MNDFAALPKETWSLKLFFHNHTVSLTTTILSGQTVASPACVQVSQGLPL